MTVINWALLFLTVKVQERYNPDTEKITTLQANPSSETALITTAAICQQGMKDKV